LRIKWTIAAALIGLLAIVGGAAVPKARPYTTWSAYGGTPDSMQYSALSQINKSNVSQLEQAWFYPLPARVELAFSPLIVGATMYVAGNGNREIVAFDAATGKQIWTPSDGRRRERARLRLLAEQRWLRPANYFLGQQLPSGNRCGHRGID
jgi:outer membrane protein assembly factor BamB